MKNIKRKIAAFALSAMLVTSAMPLSAYAAELSYTHGPTTESHPMSGAARVGFWDSKARENILVVENVGEITVHNDAVEGVTYDLNSNTLTIKDLSFADNNLFIWYMGDDFKLKVEGDCALSRIFVENLYNLYSTSLNIIGSGTLTVNKNLTNDSAVQVYSEGDNCAAHLNIADTVTVNFYAAENQPVIKLSATAISPEQGGAVTVGGKAITDLQSERIKYTDSEHADVAVLGNKTNRYSHGNRVVSKSDPDGIYAVEYYNSGTVYAVSRYVYVPEFDIYITDLNYGDSEWTLYKPFTKEEFEAEFSFVTEAQPTKIRFTSDWQQENRGIYSVQLVKADEPEEIYIGSAWWNGTSDHEPDGYYIHHLLWDENENCYVNDNEFSIFSLTQDELEANGYSFVYNEHEENDSHLVWMNPAPFDDDNYESNEAVFTRKSDPDGLYVGHKYENSNRDIYGYVIWPVQYDSEADAQYIDSSNLDTESGGVFIVTNDELENGSSDFVRKTDTVKEQIKLRWLDSYYLNFDYYASEGTQLYKDGEPDAVYCYDRWNDVIKLEWREDKGHYFRTGNDIMEFTDISEIEALGYHEFKTEQPITYYTYGYLNLNNLEVYTDDSGVRYAADWSGNVYPLNENEKVTIGSKEYYIGKAADGVKTDDLHDTRFEVVSDNYTYTVNGTEYHHTGSSASEAEQGDVNGDGKITVDDATLVQMYVAKLIGDDGINAAVSDVNGDDKVTVDDATLIQMYVAKLISKF